MRNAFLYYLPDIIEYKVLPFFLVTRQSFIMFCSCIQFFVVVFVCGGERNVDKFHRFRELHWRCTSKIDRSRFASRNIFRFFSAKKKKSIQLSMTSHPDSNIHCALHKIATLKCNILENRIF